MQADFVRSRDQGGLTQVLGRCQAVWRFGGKLYEGNKWDSCLDVGVGVPGS